MISDANFWANLPQILVALATLITSLAGLIVALRTSKTVSRVEQHTNGLVAQLVQGERKEARDAERANPTAPDNIPPATMETR